MTRLVPILLALVVSLASATAPSVASACGGCFHPPPPPMGTPTPVTGHRMAIALSPRGTTLWDQIEYAGSPDEFVWVLPVDPSARVELAEEAFFLALEDATRLTLVAPEPPRLTCPDPCGGGPLLGAASERSAFDADAGAPPVEVHHEGVVGPYETVTIESEDPDALVAWLRDRGYQVPDSVLPTIAHYTDRGSAFAVLRLRPNAGVQQMRPVRVTSPGLSTTFPLRMVAAGVTSTVDLELFVFAEGRMEAENFGNAEVDRDAITYDWDTDAFNYDQLFEDARFVGEGPGTNWVTEFAGFAPETVRWFSVTDDAGETTSSADDWAVVQAAIDRPYLTRMRAELFVNELNRDLNLQASSGGVLSETTIEVTRELNRQPEPECPTFCSGGTDGRDMRGVRCGVRHGGSSGGRLPLLVAALGGAFLVIRRRR